MRRAGAALALLLAGAAASPGRAAETYPTRPVRLVAPIAPGGGVDAMARALGPKLSARLSQPVVVDNRPGAGGSLGAELVAKAPPDGHTLLFSGSAFVVHTLLYPARYDPLADFAAVTQLNEHPYVMVLNAHVSASSVGDLIAYARKNPGALSYASSGNGSLVHLSGELFKHLAKVDMTHIPYKGLAAAMPDILSGQVHITFASLFTAAPHLKSGRLKPIGVTGAKREPALSEVPTLDESGLAGYDVTQWYGVFAPAAVPRPIVARLHSEITAAMKTAAMTQRFAAEGTRPVGSASAAFAANIRREADKWRALIAQAKLKGN